MRFQPGVTIQDVNGQEYQVEQVSEKDGLIVYHCGKEEILESKLGANMADRGPEEGLQGREARVL